MTFVMAMQFGGCTDAEAYEIMRDRFCAHLGSGIELWDTTDVPKDRWFREAWVRSHNGGPIDISLTKARGNSVPQDQGGGRILEQPQDRGHGPV